MRFDALLTLSALVLAAAVASVLATTGCLPASHVRRESALLTRTDAEARRARIERADYRLDVQLDPALGDFGGTVAIEFDLQGADRDLTVDLVGGSVESVQVNDVAVTAAYNDAFITLPASSLAEGPNEVVIAYRMPWSRDGSGLYRYDDPDDGLTYLYTDLEPYDANRVMPLFDQPDIKGRFTFTVTAPSDWHVITTDRETSIASGADGQRIWSFPTTRPLPSYVMSLHAGPYAVWEDDDFRIPLRLFARQSLAEFVRHDASMWFAYTRGGFAFFEDYYGIAYPYTKYDQLLVPDFNAGAMENAGAVTFTERTFMQRDGWTHAEKRRLASVVMHEMSHMWFGDLVTMQWWNGLWLNESFAQFMGYHAAELGLGFDDAWEAFFMRRKHTAYALDQRITRHPVETPIPDTESVFDNFDAITYSKGASVLRQIEFLLGKDVFRKGVNTYVNRHAEGNARLEDFVGALAEAAGTDLESWSREWLFTAGVNTIEACYTCEDGTITEFAIMQTAPENEPLLRTQRTQVGLYRDLGGQVVTTTVLPVTYAGEHTDVPEAIGKPCPDLVYPNHGDLAYARVELDRTTRQNLARQIGRVEDPFQRMMFWQSLWDATHYASIPVTEFLETVITAAADERHLNTAHRVYELAGLAIEYLDRMGEVGAGALSDLGPRLEAVTWNNVMRTRGDLQTIYFDRYLDLATSPRAMTHGVELLEGAVSVPGFTIDQDRRWKIIWVLNREAHPRAQALLAAETERDPSVHGRRWALKARSIQPTLEAKRTIMDQVLDPSDTTPYALQRLAMQSAFPPGQEVLLETLADESLAAMIRHEQEGSDEYYRRARAFADYFAPACCTQVSAERLAQAVRDHANSRPSILRTLQELHEDDVLCVARKALLAPTP